jgi:hypothetical protein
MPRTASRIAKTRLTLEVAVCVRDQMESIRDRVGADSITEVIRRAVALYASVLEQESLGKRFVAEDWLGHEVPLLAPPQKRAR